MAYRSNIFIGCIALILALYLLSAQSAEEEIVLLTIDGDRIDVVGSYDESPTDRAEALLMVDAYHRLLPSDSLELVSSHHAQILALIPDFEVAYAAADSAENDNVMSDIDTHLANIQSVHAKEFTEEVSGLLRKAYQLILPVFGDN